MKVAKVNEIYCGDCKHYELVDLFPSIVVREVCHFRDKPLDELKTKAGNCKSHRRKWWKVWAHKRGDGAKEVTELARLVDQRIKRELFRKFDEDLSEAVLALLGDPRVKITAEDVEDYLGESKETLEDIIRLLWRRAPIVW